MEDQIENTEPKKEEISIELQPFLESNGVLIPEGNFLTEADFYNGKTSEIEDFLEKIVSSAFENNKIEHIVLNAKYFGHNGLYRKVVHNFIDNKYPHLKSLTTGNKEYIMIARNKFAEFIKTLNKNDLYVALQNIYLRIDLRNMHLNNKTQEDDIVIEDEKQPTEEKDQEIVEKKQINIDDSDDEEQDDPFYLPVIEKIEILDIKSNSVMIKVPPIPYEKLVEKNRNIIRGFRKIFENTKINYVILILDPKTNKFYEKKTSEETDILISELNPNTGYILKVALQFGRFYSANSKPFIFYTQHNVKVVNNSYIAWGNNKSNCLCINEDTIDREDLKSRNILTPDNTLFCDNNLSRPVKLRNNEIVDFSIFSHMGLLLLANGEVVSSGSFWCLKDKNDQNEQGIKFDSANAKEVEMEQGQKPYIYHIASGVYIRKIKCGLEFCLALSNTGNCYSWGVNDFGQLGLNLPKDVIVNTPKKLTFEFEGSNNIFVTNIETGFKHCLATAFINGKTKVFSWGFSQGYEPIQDELMNIHLNQNQSMNKITNSFSPLLVKFSEDRIVKVVAKYNNSAIISSENNGVNKVYTFGKVDNCQLGYELNFPGILYWGFPTVVYFEKEYSVLDISFGNEHTLFLLKNMLTGENEVYTCGLNTNRQCGNEKDLLKIPEKLCVSNPTKISAGRLHSLILTQENKLFLVGNTDILRDKKKNIITELDDDYSIADKHVLRIECDLNNVGILYSG